MAKTTFTRHAPTSHEEGSSYDVEVDGDFVGEITSEKIYDAHGHLVVAGYAVGMLGGSETVDFPVARRVRRWNVGHEVRGTAGYANAFAALAAAKAYAKAQAAAQA